MRILPAVTFAFVSLLGSLPDTHVDDASEGRSFFIRQRLGCHAFACNKEGPRLGGLIGRNAVGAEGYGYYTEDLKNSEIVRTEETLDD